MAARDNDRSIVLFHYSLSPYARRVVWYLNLRGIPYSQCKVPSYMPRPETAAIGTKYRRVPILAIGRDIYNDTRLILAKLEELFPDAKGISAAMRKPEGEGDGKAQEQALEKLLEYWAVEGVNGVFARASQLLPTGLPLMKDEKWVKDREDFSGRSWKKESVERARPEALAEMRRSFEFVETTLLSDGREFLMKTKEPTLVDIEAVWALHWIRGIPGALPAAQFAAPNFPKVHAWIDRFDAAVRAAARSAPTQPATLSSAAATRQIEQSGFAEPEPRVDEGDLLGLRKGEEVEVWPVDTGASGRDRGRLVGLTAGEVVLEGRTEGGVEVRIHAPRHGFRVRRVGKM